MFNITPEQSSKIEVWKKECETKILAIQKETMTADDFYMKTCGGKFAYFGAIGGMYTYSFTPNSIGEMLIVTNNFLNESIDVTDFDNW